MYACIRESANCGKEENLHLFFIFVMSVGELQEILPLYPDRRSH